MSLKRDSGSPISDPRSPNRDSGSPISDSRSPIRDSRSPISDLRSPMRDLGSRDPVLRGSGHKRRKPEQDRRRMTLEQKEKTGARAFRHRVI